jgi:hypothetical protein
MNRALEVFLPKSNHVNAEAKRSEEVPVSILRRKIHRLRPETSRTTATFRRPKLRASTIGQVSNPIKSAFIFGSRQSPKASSERWSIHGYKRISQSVERNRDYEGVETNAPSTTRLHVLLGVSIGNRIQLVQMETSAWRDDFFFDELKVTYKAAKRIIRGVFGLWVYNHCNFLKVSLSVSSHYTAFKLILKVRKGRRGRRRIREAWSPPSRAYRVPIQTQAHRQNATDL